jgi:L-ascorbate metabolism protein UlaG (beta-lactamase superfamily)
MNRRTLTGMWMAASLLSAGVALAQAPAAAPAAAPKKTTATWWGHAAWIVETPGGARIAIDPWLRNPLAPKDAKWPEQLDAILITHGHSDHVGDAQELAKKTGAPLFGSFELVSLLGGGEKDVGANMGGTFKVKDVTLHLVEAVHSSGFGESKTGVKYGGNPMGYVLQVDKGPTLYHAGDTDVFQSMALIGERFKPTAALLPIGGHFTMDPEGAAVAAKLLKVKTVVPMHFGTFPLLKGTPEELTAALKAQKVGAVVHAVKPGESVTF